MLGSGAAELGQNVSRANCELCLESFLEGRDSQLLEPLRLPARELLVAELSVGRSAPELEAAPEQRGAQRCVSRLERSLPFCEQALELDRVHGAAVQLQCVGRSSPADRCGLQQLAQ